MNDTFREFEHRGWENVAAEYDLRFADLANQSIEPLLNAAGAGQGIRLLDVASGPGHAAAAAVRRGCSVLGVDFSAEMVAIARRRRPQLEFREGDAEKLDLPDRSFDAVVMNFGMLHLGQPDRAIAEAHRVLRSGGRYAFTVWETPERAVGFGIVLGAIQTHGNANVPLPEGPPFFRFSDPDESERTLKSAGFMNVRVHRVPQTWSLESGADLFTAFRTAAVRTAALLHAQTPEALDRIRTDVTDRAEALRIGNRIELAMPAVLTSAVKP
jgi:SAM-dependent methyltransferase